MSQILNRALALVAAALALPLCPALAQSPAWQWAKSPGTGHVSSTAVDAAGNVYVTGRFSGTVTFGATTLTSTDTSDAFVAKISPAGAYQWAVQGAGNGPDDGLAIALDPGGTVYVAGTYGGGGIRFGSASLPPPATTAGVFLLVLDAAGTPQAISGEAVGGLVSGYAMVFNATGGLFVTGSFAGAVQFGGASLVSAGGTDLFVAKMTPAVGWHWAIRAGGPADDRAGAVAVDAADNPYLTGAFEGTATFGSIALTSAGATDVFVGSLTPAGAWRGRVIRGGGSGVDAGTDITVSRQGVYVTGAFAGASADFGSATLTNSSVPGLRDVYVARVDTSASGSWQWAVGAGGTGDEQGLGLAVGTGGDVVLTGTFDSPASTFGGTVLSGAEDAWVGEVSAAGAWQWAKAAGGPGKDVGQAIALDSADNVVMGGEFYGTTMTCGPTVLANVGSGCAMFISRLATPNGLPADPMANPLTLTPNPAHGTVRLTGAPGATAELVDARGRHVRTVPLGPGATLDLHGLPAGLYVVRAGRLTRRLVVE